MLVSGGEYAGGASFGAGRLVGCVTAKGVEFDVRRGRPAGLLSIVGAFRRVEDEDEDTFLEPNLLKGFITDDLGDCDEQNELL